jgi:hypothetical protein
MKFQKGQSGNPAGAPKGKPHQRPAHIRALVSDKAGAIVAKIIERAESGDVEACRIFCRYLMPRHRFVPEPVNLPPAKDLIEARAQIAKLASLAAQGVLDLESMTQIARVLSMSAGLRLEELEELLANKEARDHGDN